MKTAIRLFLVLTILTGVAYPLLVTGILQGSVPGVSNGSLVSVKGHVIGSRLIAQDFHQPGYFWPRPSACGYAAPSGASNLSPGSLKLKAQVASASADMPADLVFASGSGLDPHISLAAALYQVSRVGKARQLDMVQVAKLKRLVLSLVEPRDLGVFGEERINVLALNLAVDERFVK